MTTIKKRPNRFDLQPYSRQQMRVLAWWDESSPHKKKDMIICHGAIRSGKTVAMIDSFLTWSLTKHKHQNFILAGRTVGTLRRNVIEPMLQILEHKGIPYRFIRSENAHLEIGTNTYYLFGAAHEASQDTLQGLSAAGALLDEVALFPRSFVEQAIGRCSEETDGNSAKIFMNCNPAGPYHYLKTEYIDQANKKNLYVLHFTIEDNLTLSENVKNRYRRMFSGVFYSRYVLGEWKIAEGMIYDMFDENEHVINEWPLDIHDMHVAVDYGTKNPTAFILQGIHYNDGEPTYYNLAEYYYDGRDEGRQKTDNEYYEDLVAFCRPYTEKIIIDPSAASFIALIREKGELSVQEAANDVLDGIRTVSRFLSEGRCFTHRSCTNLIREMFSYVWDEKAAQRGDDKPVKDNDHALDAVRYGIFTNEHQNVRLTEETAELLKGVRVYG